MKRLEVGILGVNEMKWLGCECMINYLSCVESNRPIHRQGDHNFVKKEAI